MRSNWSVQQRSQHSQQMVVVQMKSASSPSLPSHDYDMTWCCGQPITVFFMAMTSYILWVIFCAINIYQAAPTWTFPLQVSNMKMQELNRHANHFYPSCVFLENSIHQNCTQILKDSNEDCLPLNHNQEIINTISLRKQASSNKIQESETNPPAYRVYDVTRSIIHETDDVDQVISLITDVISPLSSNTVGKSLCKTTSHEKTTCVSLVMNRRLRIKYSLQECLVRTSNQRILYIPWLNTQVGLCLLLYAIIRRFQQNRVFGAQTISFFEQGHKQTSETDNTVMCHRCDTRSCDRGIYCSWHASHCYVDPLWQVILMITAIFMNIMYAIYLLCLPFPTATFYREKMRCHAGNTALCIFSLLIMFYFMLIPHHGYKYSLISYLQYFKIITFIVCKCAIEWILITWLSSPINDPDHPFAIIDL